MHMILQMVMQSKMLGNLVRTYAGNRNKFSRVERSMRVFYAIKQILLSLLLLVWILQKVVSCYFKGN